MNKKAKMVIVTAFAAGALVMGATSTQAGWFGADNQTGLIDKLVSVFKLNKTDVEKVFTDYRAENQKTRQAEMLMKITEKLSALVKDGKITEAQKNLILNKHKQLQTQRQADVEKWQSMTPAERMTEMAKRQTELEAWAKQNNIDISYVLGFGNGYGRGRGMMGRGMGWNK